ncbi:HAMP domain-containing protein [Kitasatospora sp. GP82]|uniref:HAMP domain-containing protein n=1 Tax=Kitasatospora sp. GP82 TaxID=3035089 RepID=UPI002474B6E7|nr:HAMP domain-containing protein [Kitasatospora sp. GP82]MDH6127353.1 signal transduction histidine kinase/HAMP domain-containing protein/CheY-like chemotaxis protein [Kitasatospora sp. GP82]
MNERSKPVAVRGSGRGPQALSEAGLRQLLTGLTAVRGGDFGIRLPQRPGLLGEIAIVFNDMADQLSRLNSEVTRVAREVGTEGRLGGQAEVPQASGTWRDLTDSVNAMAGNLTAQVRNIAQVTTAVAKGDLTQKIEVDAQGEILELKNTVNTMVDQLSAFAGEVTRVAREVGTEGRLGGQAEVEGVSGTWRDLTDSVNFMAGNLTAEVRSIAQVATAVAEGDLTQKIEVDARGEILTLKSTINTMVDQLSAFAGEVTRVAREVGTEGNLGGQATVRGVSGTWKDLTDNVNVMASNLTSQVRSISQVVTAVARGDLSQKITVETKGEVAALAGAINTMVDTLSAFADEVTRVAREVGTEGMLGGQARVPNVAGTWKDLTDNVNSMANNLTNQVRNIAQVTTAVAQGDLTRKIDVDARGEILALKTTINTMVDQLSSFAAEVTRVAREVGSQGRLGGQAEVEGVSGTWKRLTENVNELAGNLTRQVRAIAEVTSAVAEGDLTRSITVDASGEVADLKDNINAMVESLRETTRANQEQDWLKTNLARLTGLIQGHRELAAVAELIMDELTPLLWAQYGAFYLAEESADGTELVLITSYGRSNVTGPERIGLGQSLVGQAARSRRIITVQDLPSGYATISSSLGHAAPRELIVLPIVVEDQLLGVVELAALHSFSQLHRDFLERFAEAVGANLSTLLANARTDELLEESQRLTAELRARSEELQRGQEELRRSNAELEDKADLLAAQNRDIEAKNLEIEHARHELEARAQQLTRASMYKSEFLANMSHELRTPLNSLLILAQLLAQNPAGNLTSKQVEYAEVIRSAGSDLLQLINDILDLSKVEAGKMDITVEHFPLSELLEYVRSTFRPLAGQKNLEFEVITGPEVPEELVTDQARLRQVLRNLLSNAVKFTDRGRVELRIEPTAADELPEELHGTAGVLAFRVADTGIGIAEQHLESIFGAFQQADGTTGRTHGGTGLGLSISRELAHLLGGVITTRSTVGEGSCFTLHLPVGAGPQETKPPAPERPEPLGLLVVEADPPGLLSLLAESGTAGRDATRVRSIGEVDEALTALEAGRFRCLVLDLALPDDGARRLLAALEDRGLDVPVLGYLSGPGEQARAFHTERLDVVPGLDELRERIVQAVGTERHADSDRLVPPATADGPLAGRTVLVVDDDSRTVYAITGFLELHGMRVLHAGSGRRGLELLRANPDTSLILMDLMMPELDGYAAMAAIRDMAEFSAIPIIAVTAKAMPGDRAKSIAAGANDHVTKPVDTEYLISRIRRWLDR